MGTPQNVHIGKSQPPFRCNPHCFERVSKPPYYAPYLPCSLDAHHQALSLFQKQDSYQQRKRGEISPADKTVTENTDENLKGRDAVARAVTRRMGHNSQTEKRCSSLFFH